MKRLAIALSAIAFAATVATAEAQQNNAAPISPAAVEQIVLAQNLAALGAARKDPLLLLAAAQIRAGLDQTPIPEAATFQSLDDILKQAKEYAAGREDLIALADDIAAGTSRGWQPGGSYCFGSSCSGHGF